MMPITDFIAAIELGSSKISGIAGRKGSNGGIQVLALAQEDSASFIKKGVVFNLDKTASALTSIINKLESQLNDSIGQVYVGIGGQSLHSLQNVITKDLKEETVISQEIIDSICDENLAYPLVDKEILDVVPQEYKIGINTQLDPIGISTNHIEGNFLNIIARTSLKKNLDRSFKQAQIKIADTMIAPIEAAKVILTEPELRSGCALVDFGADTTTVSIFKNSILRYLCVIPLGGNNITNDLTSLRIEAEEAENLKKRYGIATTDEEADDEAAPIQLQDGRTVSFSEFNNIVEGRAEEIVANVVNQIELSGIEDKLLGGIVLTGGGSNLKDIDELVRQKSKASKVRTAGFIHNEVFANGVTLQKEGTENSLLGLLFAGKENCREIVVVEEKEPEPKEEAPKSNLFDDDEAIKEQEEEARRKKKERKEEERRQKLEEKKRKEEEAKKNKKNWFENLSQRLFTQDDDME